MKKTLFPVVALLVACGDGNPLRPEDRSASADVVPSSRVGEMTLTSVDYPGAVSTQVLGANDRGDVVGQYVADAGGPTQAFQRDRHGGFTTIECPTGPDAGAWDISLAGDILCQTTVGSYLLSDAGVTGVVYPGASGGTAANSLGRLGEIVGYYVNAGVYHGFLLRDGAYTTIDVPSDWGAAATMVWGINSWGDLVGWYLTNRYRGFLLRSGVFTRIDYPGAVDTYPSGINDRGDIAGGYAYADGVPGAFLMRLGQFTSLDVIPGSGGVRAINNRGEMVGGYQAESGAVHGFIVR